MIVTNHDLVLSDLRLGGGVILPAPEDSLYVFDEGHQLPAKCLNQFALRFHAGGTLQGLRDSERWLAASAEAWVAQGLDERLIPAMKSLVGDLIQRSEVSPSCCGSCCPRQILSAQSIAFPMAAFQQILLNRPQGSLRSGISSIARQHAWRRRWRTARRRDLHRLTARSLVRRTRI